MSHTPSLSLQAVEHDSAQGRAREVLDTALAQVGFIPNMYANMVNSPGVLETYLLGYRLFRAESGFDSAEQEVVFLAISRDNGCEYCMAAHSTLAARKSGVAEEVIEAIREDRTIPDERLSVLYQFTRHLVQQRGWPQPAEVSAFTAAGYSERQILEIVLAISVKTLSNYANHLFATPVDDMFAGYAWSEPRAEAV